MWYGWQILIPGIVADALLLGGFFTFGGSARWGLLGTAASIHGLSGPIVHLANGQPLKAALSFVIEAVVPGGVVAATAAAAAAASCSGDCPGVGVVAYSIFPVSWVTGLVVDTAVLAKKEVKPKPEKDLAISLAPLVLPKVHPNSSTPVGLSLVGRF